MLLNGGVTWLLHDFIEIFMSSLVFLKPQAIVALILKLLHRIK